MVYLSCLYPQKVALTSPTSGGRSVGIVRSRTQTMEEVLFKLSVMENINKEKSSGPSKRANYTDWTTATCRRS
jgi:hypothetical protein